MKKNAPGHASREMNVRAFHTRTSERRLGALVIAVQGHFRSWGISIGDNFHDFSVFEKSEHGEKTNDVLFL